MPDDDDEMENLYTGIFAGGFVRPTAPPRSSRRRAWRQNAQRALSTIASIAHDAVIEEADELTVEILEAAQHVMVERPRMMAALAGVRALSVALGVIVRAIGCNGARLMLRVLEPLVDGGVQRGMLLELD